MNMRYAGIIRSDTAVGFYRLVQPLRFIHREKLADCRMTPFTGQQQTGETKEAEMPYPDRVFMFVCDKADIIWSNFTSNYDEMRKMLNLRHHFNSKLIIDIDDNLYAVHRDNPAQKNSQQFTENFELLFSMADGITVSVPSLKKVYEKINPNIYVNPNTVDFSLIKPPVKHKKIRIGWEGAYGHKADLELVYPALRELKKKYDFEVVIFGMTPKQGISDPGFPVEYHDWVWFLDDGKDENMEYKYYDVLSNLGLDIAIAPLIDSSYNRCKSNLRVLENGAMQIPVVASPTENQKDMPLLYARTNYDWYEQLEKLIVSAKLRKEKGEELYKFIDENYNPSKLVKPLNNWMQKLDRREDMDPDKFGSRFGTLSKKTINRK